MCIVLTIINHISDVASKKTKDFSYRLNNSMSIFSAELTATKIAVEVAVKTLSTENKITIFSDSLSGLTSLRSPALKNSPNLVKEIYHLISTNKLNISLMWVPSHIGVVGSEHADRLAAMGTTHSTIDIEMMQDYKELKPKINPILINYGNKNGTRSTKEIYTIESPQEYTQKNGDGRREKLKSLHLNCD
jgi:ribonuclease HI